MSPHRSSLIFFVSCIAVAVAAAQEVPGGCAQTDLASLRAAAAKSPENIGLQLRLGKALVDAMDKSLKADDTKRGSEEVAAIFKRALERNPDALMPLRAFARDAYYGRQLAEAVTYARRLLAVEPDDADTAVLLVKALLLLEKEDEAAAFLLDWFRSGLAPTSGSVQGLLAAFATRPKLRQALDTGFVKLLESAPRDTLLRLTYASFLTEIGRTSEAWTEFHRAEKDGLCDTVLGVRHPFALSLANRVAEPADPAAAPSSDVDDLRKAADAHPDHAGLRLRLARRLELPADRAKVDEARRKKTSEEALVEYKRACEINPDCFAAHFRTGELLMELGRPAEGLPYVEKALAKFPSYAPWRLTEAEAKATVGDVAGAAQDFVAYARRFESDALVRRLIERLEKSGKKPWNEFIAALESAAKAAPHNAYLRSNLAYLRLKNGDAAGARESALEAERLGMIGADGLGPHYALKEAFGLSNAPAESAPKKD